MKKLLHLCALFAIIAISSSCNKSIDSNPAAVDLSEETETTGKGCCCQCPTAVPEALAISYSLSFWQPEVVILVDLSYENNGPNGSMRVVLRNANNDIDSVAILPAPNTPNGPEILHLEYTVPANGFPYRLVATGRPANLDCETRVRRSYIIDNEVSR